MPFDLEIGIVVATPVRPAQEASFFSVDAKYTASKAVITLTGELDIATAPLLHDQLMQAAGADVDTVQVNVAGLKYVDSTGLGVLVTAQQRLAATGRSLEICWPSPRLVRLLEITGLDDFLTIRT